MSVSSSGGATEARVTRRAFLRRAGAAGVAVAGGAMNGFWQASNDFAGDGDAALGYYTGRELPFYYSLLEDSALCANYHCSLLGPTWPNRFYFAAGTSGGITTNGIWGYGVFD